jgi:hypothetical protein
MTLPACIDFTMSAVTSTRDRLGLLLLRVLAELLGVAAGPLRVLPFHLDELGAEALDLLLDHPAHVECFDHRAEATRGAYGLQTRHARPEDQHARGRDRPGRGHQHRKELGQRGGGHEHGLVARRRRLRGQDVHHLRHGRARDHVDGEGRDLPGRQGAHELEIEQRIEQRDERATLAQEGDVRQHRGTDLHDDFGICQDGREVRLHTRAGSAVLVVAREGRRPGPAFDRDVDLLGAEALDRVGHDGDAAFAGRALFSDGDPHRSGGGIQGGRRRWVKPT